jgi:ABC-type glutathione transport system ATPase component
MTNRKYQVTIRSANRTIVSIDNFAVPQNRITFLFGESGIGKSMISKAIYGLLDPDELDVTINRETYAKYCNQQETRDIQENGFFVFQEPSSHLNSLMKITEQLTEGSLKGTKDDKEILNYLWQTASDDAIRKIIDIYPKPYRPSGGEKQRVLLAMAFKKISMLVQSHETEGNNFFVFDEPTGSLDDNYRNLFLKLLFRMYKHKPFTILLITHDYSIISEIYKKYKHLLDHILFKELSRIDDTRVTLNDFFADEYLDWLRATTQKKHLETGDEMVLDVNSEFKIFDRSLTICRDETRKQPANLEIRKGEMVYLKAASGAGKTTLAKIIMGLYPPQQFTMNIGGLTVTEKTSRAIWQKKIWGTKAGMVFQHADEALNLQAKVKETFKGLPLKKRLKTDTLKNRLKEFFEDEMTETFLHKKVFFLSGGQKQRLNLLRTLIMNTDLIILDEPLNGLDFISIKKVLTLLEEKRKQGSAILMISHNEEIFDNVVDKDYIFYLS